MSIQAFVEHCHSQGVSCDDIGEAIRIVGRCYRTDKAMGRENSLALRTLFDGLVLAWGSAAEVIRVFPDNASLLAVVGDLPLGYDTSGGQVKLH